MKMCKILICAVFLASFVFCGINEVKAGGNKWSELLEECGMVLAEIQKMPDRSIPQDLLKACEAVAIFPNTISGGLGIGGKYGQGIIMARSKSGSGWSSPAIFTLAGGSVGWQVGGQATDIVLLIMNKRSVDGILKGKFKLGADAAVSAGPVGRDAEASADIHGKGTILSYSRSRGLFAGIKLEGLILAQHRDGNSQLYGKRFSAKEIVMENKAKMPEEATELLRVLR